MGTEATRIRLLEEQERLNGILRSFREQFADVGSELTSVDQHPADAGSDTFERSKDLAILERTQRQLADVERALQLLAQGGYGLCEACGKPIGSARLAARPAARLCLRDQELAEAEAEPAR